ncbi:MAG: hypothetical protein KF763_20985 [Cyclobacteriaceae bacterium]|nr:hypothetical protein [Cyclobacteriaceae bacterium]
MKKLGLIIGLIITATISYGQQRTIYGTVTSAVDGKIIKGVKVILVEERIDRLMK